MFSFVQQIPALYCTAHNVQHQYMLTTVLYNNFPTNGFPWCSFNIPQYSTTFIMRGKEQRRNKEGLEAQQLVGKLL